MPDSQTLVINTGPILALIAAQGNLQILKKLYKRVIVTHEVKEEICYKGLNSFGVNEFKEATFLTQINEPLSIAPLLKNSIDIGEASVIQYASDNDFAVCIDETVGRRMARLYDLRITGSLGILLKAKKQGYDINIVKAISSMKQKGIFISEKLANKALKMASKSE